MVAVLDNFHFDLSLAQPLHGEDTTTAGTNSGQEISDMAPDEDEETKAGHQTEDLPMEEDSEETREGKSLREGELSKQRAMAQKIHRAIVNSILPSLEAVLTKRVSMLTFTTC